MEYRPSEAETFWTPFVASSPRRGLRGSNTSSQTPTRDIKAAVAEVLNALPRPLHA